MSNVIYRRIGENLPRIVSGHGCWIVDVDGKCYLDLSSGPVCTSLGHSNRTVIEAMQDQLNLIPNAFSGFWSSDPAEEAADAIAERFNAECSGWFGKALFLNGGGEAVDLACKLAFQVHAAEGRHKREFACLEHAFHGVGLLPFALSGSYPRYQLIEPYHVRVQRDYTVRFPHPMTRPDALDQARRIFNLYHRTMAALIIEPIGGPPVGCWVHPRAYMQGLRELCDEYQVLLIYDEVLCGAGRCGFMSAATLYDVWPDITILGKNITSGYMPMSVLCLSQNLVQRLGDNGAGVIQFGTTYSAHTLGCTAIAATLDYMREKDLWKVVYQGGDMLPLALLENTAHCPPVGGVQGNGFLWGLDLIDPATKVSFPASVRFHERCRNAIRERGVVVYSKGQTVHGGGDYLVIAPPFEISAEELYLGMHEVRNGIMEAWESVK